MAPDNSQTPPSNNPPNEKITPISSGQQRLYSRPTPIVPRSTETTKGELLKINHSFQPNPDIKPFKPELLKLNFLDAYYEEMTPTHTCMRIGVSLSTFQVWLNNDPRFRKAWEEVFSAVGDRLKRVAMARGIRGSDDLLKFLLKYHDPAFRERSHLDIDPKLIDNIVNAMLDALRKTIPEICPHCKTNLGLTGKVTTMLQKLSKGIG